MLTLEKILEGDYDLSKITEYDHNLVWYVLRITIDEEERNKTGGIDKLRAYQKQMRELTEDKFRRVDLVCSVCKKGASWNVPVIDDEGNIYCQTCANKDRSGNVLRGIEQRSSWKGDLKHDRNHKFQYNGFILSFYENVYGFHTGKNYTGTYVRMARPMYSISAWIPDGSAYPLTKEEKIKSIEDPLSILKEMERFVESGSFRCTSCKEDFPIKELGGIGGHPLFAGKVCKPCYKIYLKKLDEERKAGHVCPMCRQPFSSCCC